VGPAAVSRRAVHGSDVYAREGGPWYPPVDVSCCGRLVCYLGRRPGCRANRSRGSYPATRRDRHLAASRRARSAGPDHFDHPAPADRLADCLGRQPDRPAPDDRAVPGFDQPCVSPLPLSAPGSEQGTCPSINADRGPMRRTSRLICARRHRGSTAPAATGFDANASRSESLRRSRSPVQLHWRARSDANRDDRPHVQIGRLESLVRWAGMLPGEIIRWRLTMTLNSHLDGSNTAACTSLCPLRRNACDRPASTDHVSSRVAKTPAWSGCNSVRATVGRPNPDSMERIGSRNDTCSDDCSEQGGV